jgi:uncharacterized protein (DUF1501 family)
MSDRCHHCNEFSRASLVRKTAAEAGRGLPSIEAGMPLPAGTGLDRRSFVTRSLGLALSIYGVGKLGLFDEGIAHAASGPARPVLVSVFLPGGTDALSVLYPANDAKYRKLRPKLALDASQGKPFAEDTRLYWHPSLSPLATLYGEGKVSVMPAVGYTHPDQSHFTSRHFWEVGATDARLVSGWMGRYLDRAGSKDNPLQGLSLDYQLQPAIASTRVPVASLASPDDYSFWASGVWGEVENRMLAAMGPLGARRRDPFLNQAAKAAAQSDKLRRQLVPFKSNGNGYGSPVAYPKVNSGFPNQLAGLAAMLAANLPLRCVAITAPGEYDTHSDQPQVLADGLDVTAQSLYSFQRDLEARGLADRVLTLVWSEFGRRAEENGSDGTDHGAAGTAFLIGTRVRGKMIGEFPGVTNLDNDGNLRNTSDFRSLYCSLLEQWFNADAKGIIPHASSFGRVPLLK